jgi:ribonuclease P protein component
MGLRQHRFPSRKMLSFLFKGGKKRVEFPLRFRVMDAEDNETRFCMIIRKKVGIAVWRNRLRRIMREEIFRNIGLGIKPIWFAVDILDFGITESDLKKSLKQFLDHYRLDV